MQQGMYIFEDAEDFIQFIDDLTHHYEENKPNNLVELTKPLFSKSEMEKEVKFLNKCRLNTFTEYPSNKIIKVNVTHSNCNYLVTYYFKGSINSNLTIYKQFYHYLRKREWKT